MTNARVRYGILGTANIAIKRFIPGALSAHNAVVHAIASRDLPRAREVAARFAIPIAYGSYRELLDDPEIDAVYIPLPNTLHAEWAIAAALVAETFPVRARAIASGIFHASSVLGGALASWTGT